MTDSSETSHVCGIPSEAFVAFHRELQWNVYSGFFLQVLILGEAFSETAGRIGRIVYSRARIEVHAIRVSDQKVLLTASAYGAGSDVADLVAGKKAIEQATDTMSLAFPADIVKAWTKK